MPRPPRAQTTNKRWNQNGAAAQFMREGITSGEIDISQQPKVIYDTYPMQFDGHLLDQVWVHINKMRTSKGAMLVSQGAFNYIIKHI